MKTLLSTCLALCALAFTASAQIDINATSLNGGTNNIAATTANAMTAVSPTYTVKGANVGLQISGKLTGAGTSAVTVMIDTSLDGVVWKSGVHALAFTANGTTVAGNNTNISFGAVPFFRFNYVTNANATAVTNLSVKYSVKPGL